jgi:DNA-binding winged helix-turn-helix (wHTH) protein/Tol biopolymer transport system component
MKGESKRVYSFGGFRLDAQERLLIHHGKPVPLAPKAFDVLLLLVQNAGRLVDKDDLIKQLWADTFVEEGNLTKHISLLRKVLGEAENGQEYISTVPKRGYRFVGRVTEVMENGPKTREGGGGDTGVTRSVATISSSPQAGEDAGATVAVAEAEGAQGALPQKQQGGSGSPVVSLVGSGRRAVLLASGATFILTALLSYWWFTPKPLPRVVRSFQITHSGRVEDWGRIIIDGGRLLFMEREGNRWNLVQTSTTGGEAQPVPAPFQNTRILDISPDRSEFLVASFLMRGTEMPLWVMPVAGGSPRRLGDIMARDAVWFPGGRQILFIKGSDLYLVERDGNNARKFVGTSGEPDWLAWSPEGRVLRFTLSDTEKSSSSLWEVAANGTGLHPLLPGWNNPPAECCGSWTPDGRYFLFSSRRGGIGNIWALPETPPFFRHAPRQPVELTSGPTQMGGGVPSQDGKRLFVFGIQPQTAVVRYDAKIGRFVPLAPWARIWWATFSRDGQQIAYVTTPESVLYRSKADGSDRLHLTYSPMNFFDVRWSPDGKQIAFAAAAPAEPTKLYVVSWGGGTPREMAPEWHDKGRFDWSPDGSSLVFAITGHSSSPAAAVAALYVVELKTNKVSKLVGSERLVDPALSPDGRYLAAVATDFDKLMLFDFDTRQWAQVAQGTLLTGMSWSRDGKDLYFQDLIEVGQPVYRLCPSDHHRERVTGCEKLLQAEVFRCGLAGLAPDDSLLLQLRRGWADIYALDLDLP